MAFCASITPAGEGGIRYRSAFHSRRLCLLLHARNRLRCGRARAGRQYGRCPSEQLDEARARNARVRRCGRGACVSHFVLRCTLHFKARGADVRRAAQSMRSDEGRGRRERIGRQHRQQQHERSELGFGHLRWNVGRLPPTAPSSFSLGVAGTIFVALLLFSRELITAPAGTGEPAPTGAPGVEGRKLMDLAPGPSPPKPVTHRVDCHNLPRARTKSTKHSAVQKLPKVHRSRDMGLRNTK